MQYSPTQLCLKQWHALRHIFTEDSILPAREGEAPHDINSKAFQTILLHTLCNCAGHSTGQETVLARLLLKHCTKIIKIRWQEHNDPTQQPDFSCFGQKVSETDLHSQKRDYITFSDLLCNPKVLHLAQQSYLNLVIYVCTQAKNIFQLGLEARQQLLQ